MKEATKRSKVSRRVGATCIEIGTNWRREDAMRSLDRIDAH
jgi:hypothetical protein